MLQVLDCSAGRRRVYVEHVVPFTIDGVDGTDHPCLRGWPIDPSLSDEESEYRRELVSPVKLGSGVLAWGGGAYVPLSLM
jgi:hypothetical protein